MHARVRVPSLALILACLTMIGACASLSSPALPERDALAVRYDCGGKRLDVVFRPALEQAEVRVDGAAVVALPQQRAASGFWYEASGYELRGKGGEATWTALGQAPLTCRALD